MTKTSDEMRDLVIYLQPGGGCTPEQLERWADEYDALEQEVEILGMRCERRGAKLERQAKVITKLEKGKHSLRLELVAARDG